VNPVIPVSNLNQSKRTGSGRAGSRESKARPDMAGIDRVQFERELWGSGLEWVAGVDEAGRGPLAGPVVAAAVMLPAAWGRDGLPPALEGLNDSKQLSEARRDRYYDELISRDDVLWQVAQLDAGEIDRLNILKATHAAMGTALAGLRVAPQHVLVDGLKVRTLGWPQTPLVKGDSRSYSIAAASVLAKVTRDRQMLEADRLWPAYGFGVHNGYPTPVHLQALAEHGPCPIHRRTFAPLRAWQPDLFALDGG
jgi:ribonuclease HII